MSRSVSPATPSTSVTALTLRAFAETVQSQRHAMAGAVIAVSAAQAVALGRACLAISREDQELTGPGVDTAIQRLSTTVDLLLCWADQDADAIARFVALREAGQELQGQRLLCQAPAQVGSLAVGAADLLQGARSWVSERVRDDLEMSISLLAGTAQAAMLLLDSNLRIWPEPALLDEFEPIRARLEAQIHALSPVARIRGGQGDR